MKLKDPTPTIDRFEKKMARIDALHAQLTSAPKTGVSPRPYEQIRTDAETWDELKKINDGLRTASRLI